MERRLIARQLCRHMDKLAKKTLQVSKCSDLKERTVNICWRSYQSNGFCCDGCPFVHDTNMDSKSFTSMKRT